MQLKTIVGILLIASLILIFTNGAVAQYGNSEECPGDCDQLRDGSCQDTVADCEDHCIPIGDEHKHRNGQNR